MLSSAKYSTIDNNNIHEEVDLYDGIHDEAIISNDDDDDEDEEKDFLMDSEMNSVDLHEAQPVSKRKYRPHSTFNRNFAIFLCLVGMIFGIIIAAAFIDFLPTENTKHNHKKIDKKNQPFNTDANSTKKHADRNSAETHKSTKSSTYKENQPTCSLLKSSHSACTKDNFDTLSTKILPLPYDRPASAALYCYQRDCKSSTTFVCIEFCL